MAVWLVTGCSSGFGEALVHEILARGDKVIATGRNAATKLSHLRTTGAAILDLDVTAPQKIIDAKIQNAIAIHGKIDHLVNNAGFCLLGLAEELGAEEWAQQLNTNFFGSTNVTRALLPHFRAAKSGKIIFMSSIYAMIGDPGIGAYAVSKHAISAYATTINKEVSQFGIRAIEFNIGHFRTSFISGSSFKQNEIADYKPLWDGLVAAAPSMNGFQPGDVKKGVQRMVDVVKGEGFASGKEMPERMPIGADALEIVRERSRAILKVCDEWAELSGSTDRDGPKEGAWAINGAYAH